MRVVSECAVATRCNAPLCSLPLLKGAHPELWARECFQVFCNTLQHAATMCHTRSSCSESTRWRTTIGYQKLQVIFRKRATSCRAIWLKMKYMIYKASHGSSPPCSKRGNCSCFVPQHSLPHCNTMQLCVVPVTFPPPFATPSWGHVRWVASEGVSICIVEERGSHTRLSWVMSLSHRCF